MELTITGTRRIAIQGVKGAYHEIAARKFFGNDIELEMCDSFPRLFRALSDQAAQYGVVAIENSVAGSLLPNYALLRKSDLVIVGEVYLRIRHCLMALPGQSLSQIKEVHSHPMAIQQCHDFFGNHPEIKLVEREDTAGSSAWIAENNRTGVAAIASELAAQHYGLEVMAAGIEDNPRNFTRFLIVLDRETAEKMPVIPNKASVCFHLLHEVGSLAKVLGMLGEHGMNLSKIQSMPIVGKEWEYDFHMDLEFEDYREFLQALKAIEPMIDQLRILGEYPRGDKETNS
ncbi:prephenate dehydratase [Pontibacter sp. G13]|uniref:prephenate dehydratase n=1 Tax=Pontibacter sp. G13 TaxID=3074898 RepID=UPI00288B7618|nr:prephenate dehydratase [Pontibacter sp. G13]WNJ17544.1 prephenate dehydratase [Pontibacter sp. G13]